MLGMIFGNWFADLMFYGIPVVALILFVVSLMNYRKTKRRARENPGSVPPGKLKGKLILTVILGVIACCLTIVVVSFAALLFMVIAFM